MKKKLIMLLSMCFLVGLLVACSSSMSDDVVKVSKYKGLEIPKGLSKDITNEKERYVMEALVKNCEFVKEPTEEIDTLYKSQMSPYETAAQSAGKDLDAYLEEQTGKSADEVKKMVRESCIKQIKQQHALKLIAEKEKMTIEDDEFSSEVADLAIDYNFQDSESFLKAYGEDKIKEYLMNKKVVKFLVDNAVESDKVSKDDFSSSDNTKDVDDKIDVEEKTEVVSEESDTSDEKSTLSSEKKDESSTSDKKENSSKN